MDYMHARYYGAANARFLTPDPLPGSTPQPGSWNRYIYALARPTVVIDLDGRAPVLVRDSHGFHFAADDDDDGEADEIQQTRDAIAQDAKEEAGNNDWAKTGTAGPGVGSYKCSAYVSNVLNRASVPAPQSKSGHPISAGDWGNTNVNIPGWVIVSTPKPGDIVAKRETGAWVLDIPIVGGIAIRWFGAATGHVAIVTGNLRTTGASPEGVRTKMWPWRPDDHDKVVIRRFVGF
jgi:hypothetical protein